MEEREYVIAFGTVVHLGRRYSSDGPNNKIRLTKAKADWLREQGIRLDNDPHRTTIVMPQRSIAVAKATPRRTGGCCGWR